MKNKYELIRKYKTRDFTYCMLRADGRTIIVGAAVFNGMKERGEVNETA